MFINSSHIPDFPSWMDDAARDDVMREGIGRVSQDKSLLFWTLALIGPPLIWTAIAWSFPTLHWSLKAIILVALTTATGLALVAWQRRIFHRSIRGVLRERGVNVCPTCGYSLADLPTATNCPECGDSISTMPTLGQPTYGFFRRGTQTLCIACNYDLSGLKPTTCPECGGAISGL